MHETSDGLGLMECGGIRIFDNPTICKGLWRGWSSQKVKRERTLSPVRRTRIVARFRNRDLDVTQSGPIRLMNDLLHTDLSASAELLYLFSSLHHDS